VSTGGFWVASLACAAYVADDRLLADVEDLGL
jgi:hypothetical protein